MAVSTKYGKLDIGKIADDEPVFVLRARDETALLAIKDYRSRALALGLDSIVASVDAEIEAFETFRSENETKLPD